MNSKTLAAQCLSQAAQNVRARSGARVLSSEIEVRLALAGVADWVYAQDCGNDPEAVLSTAVGAIKTIFEAKRA